VAPRVRLPPAGAEVFGRLRAATRSPPAQWKPGGRLDFADLCRRYTTRNAAARLAAGAFAAEPELAEGPDGHHYNAACAAALAAAGRDRDAAALGEAERTRLRRQAVAWLRADLAAWEQRARQSESSRATARQTLAHWREDPDLAGVRDPAELAKLPPEERREWERLWADAGALLSRALGSR
jgi:eukaryotic-like serine/threonine-protein kinase